MRVWLVALLASLSWAACAGQTDPAADDDPCAGCPAGCASCLGDGDDELSPPCAGTPVFCDDFTDPALASSYVVDHGAWTRDAGLYRARHDVAWERGRAVRAPRYSDFDVTVEGRSVGDAGFGIAYAKASLDEGFAVIVHPAQFQGVYVKELVAGAQDRDIASVPLPAPTAELPLVLRVRRIGSSVTAWLDGMELLTTDDGGTERTGQLGLLISVTDETVDAGADFTLLRIDSAAEQRLSGMRWASGAFNDHSDSRRIDWETFRSAANDVETAFVGRDSVPAWLHPWYLDIFEGFPGRLSLAVPLWPENGSLTAAASGAYDDTWQEWADLLVARGRGDSIVRLAWEMDGDWFWWRVTPENLSEWRAAWERAARIIKTRAPEIEIDLNFSHGAVAFMDRASVLPDDMSLVDYIGVDSYDWWNPVFDEGDWQAKWSGAGGWAYFLDIAEEHGKKLSVPEWGSTAQGGDNPFFITKMMQMFASLAAADQMGYEAYFDALNTDAHYIESKPLASAEYQAQVAAARP